jgi:hypothetical protein
MAVATAPVVSMVRLTGSITGASLNTFFLVVGLADMCGSKRQRLSRK